MKIGHFADVHAREKDYDECEKCLGFIVETVEEEKPDLVAFSGDVFHSRDVRLDSRPARLVFESFSRLADVAPVVAVIGTPTHDGRAPEILSMIRGKHPIYMATRPEQIYLTGRGLLGVSDLTPYEQVRTVITLVPQPTKEFWAQNNGGSIAQTDDQIAQAMSAVFMGFGGMAAQYRCPHILCFHGTARGAKLCNNQYMIGREIEITREHIELSRAHLCCFGHIHLPQEVFPNTFYAGSIYAVDIGEAGKHGFYIHEISES